MENSSKGLIETDQVVISERASSRGAAKMSSGRLQFKKRVIHEKEIIADWINEAIENWQDNTKLASIKSNVIELTKKFPLYPELS